MDQRLLKVLQTVLAAPKAKTKPKPKKSKPKIRYEESYGGIPEDDRILNLIPDTDAIKEYIFDDEKTLGGVIAYSGDLPIGFASIHSTAIETGESGSELYAIIEMIVSSKFRKQGIGDTLIKKVIKVAKDDDFEHFIGYTNHSPGFKKLSQKYGIIDVDEASSDIGWANIEDDVPLDEIERYD